MPFFILSTLLMGAAGFLAGFVGPILVTPDANQGPLLGIFITGPLGVVAGAILGFVLPRVVKERFRLRILVAFAGTTLVGIVAGLVLLRGPEFVGRLYYAEVTNARPAVELLPSAIQKWEDSAKHYTHTPPAGWLEDRRKLVNEAAGRVVTLRNLSTWFVYRQRKFWNKGSLTFTAQPPEAERNAYLASSVQLDSPGWFLSQSSGVPAEWPPRNAGDFLGVVEIIPAPSEFRPPAK